MSGLRSRRKGAAFERLIASRFREVLPQAKRGLQMQSGQEAPDVDAAPFWVECKVGARPRMEAALRQAEDDAPKGRIPVAVTKTTRQKPIVSLRLDEFLELLGLCEWQ